MNKLLPHFILLCSFFATAQDLTQIGKAKLFTLGGGISANSVYYNGEGQRDPFTYVLNGNLNLNISNVYNLPISFAYSNQEFNFSQPFRFNRLSLSPSYKWLTAHIGDVTMTFSPYTLSGHQFSGLGIDATPTPELKISAMYGRLIKENEFDSEDPQAIAAFRRTGYGLKAAYDFDKFSLGAIIFAASDDVNSLEIPVPVEADVNPQENVVLSLSGKTTLFKKAILQVEYANSGITEDKRAGGNPANNGAVNLFLQGNATTNYYNAFNAQINMSVGNGSVGATYERVDPEYRTLGAYFFNNDLENIAVNASQTIFNNAVNLSVNAGLQRDNLDDTKTTELQRVVGAVNVAVKATEKLNINASYSTFQSVTNIRDQFDFINAVSPLDNIDTLNYRQLSRSATLNMTYAIAKTEQKSQNASINLSLQDTEDLQEQFLSGTQSTVGATTFLNTGANYSLQFVPIDLNITAGINASFNTTIETENNTLGPTLAVSKLFLDKKIRSSLAASYNQSTTEGVIQNRIVNIRLNAGYQLLEKHQFNLSLLSLFRNTPLATAQTQSEDFTATLGYNYSFSTGKKTAKRQQQNNTTPQKGYGDLTTIQFRANGQIYEGSAPELDKQISLQKDEAGFAFAPVTALEPVNTAKLEMLGSQNATEKELKEAAIDYLSAIEEYNAFAKAYTEAIQIAVFQLRRDARALDGSIKREYVIAESNIKDHPYKGKPLSEITDTGSKEYASYKTLYASYEKRLKIYTNHTYMLDKLEAIKGTRGIQKDPQLAAFKKEQVDKIYNSYISIKNNDAQALSTLITGDLIIYYQNLANTFAN